MSCSFWNMRRRLRAQQQQKDKIIVNIAEAQAKEAAEKAKETEEAAEKPKKRGTK